MSQCEGKLRWSIDDNSDGEIWLGQAGDKPIVGDWNGDDQSDFGLMRPSNLHGVAYVWQLFLQSDKSPSAEFRFGLTGDIPTAVLGIRATV